MRLRVLRMLTTDSLTAFSSANLTTTGLAGSAGITQVRDVRLTPPSAASAPAKLQAAPSLPATPPSTTLPRGSLLNLSV